MPVFEYNTNKAIDVVKAYQAIEAFNEYMNARELTKQAIKQNKMILIKVKKHLQPIIKMIQNRRLM